MNEIMLKKKTFLYLFFYKISFILIGFYSELIESFNIITIIYIKRCIYLLCQIILYYIEYTIYHTRDTFNDDKQLYKIVMIRLKI